MPPMSKAAWCARAFWLVSAVACSSEDGAGREQATAESMDAGTDERERPASAGTRASTMREPAADKMDAGAAARPSDASGRGAEMKPPSEAKPPSEPEPRADDDAGPAEP